MSEQPGQAGWLQPLRDRVRELKGPVLTAAATGLGEAAELHPLVRVVAGLHLWAVGEQGQANVWAYLETMAQFDEQRFGVLEDMMSDLSHEVAALDGKVEGLIARGGRRAADAESERLASLLGAVVADGVHVGSETGSYEAAHLLIDVVGSLHEAEVEVLVALETPYPDPLADKTLERALRREPRMLRGALSSGDLSDNLPELEIVIAPVIKRLEGRGLVKDVTEGTYNGGGAAVDPEDPEALRGKWSATPAARRLLQYLEQLPQREGRR